jgi:hypothetical protein
MADHSIRLKRLGKLQSLGLAEQLGEGRWRLADDLEARLRALGERGDIIRTMQRALTRARIARAGAELNIVEGGSGSLSGRLVERGLADEMSDRHYLILDGLDGRAHHLLEPAGSPVEGLAPGSILQISADAPRVRVHSVLPLDRLPAHDGATWLDRELASSSPSPLRDAGFGKEVRSALRLRRLWLIEQGLAAGEGGSFALVGGAIDELERRELLRTAARISHETGLAFAELAPGERIEGLLRRRIDTASKQLAMVEQGRQFFLLPWRPSLERHLEREVSGLMRASGFDWRRGRARGIER